MSLFGKGEGQASGACQMPGRHGSVVGWKRRGRVKLAGRGPGRDEGNTEWPSPARCSCWTGAAVLAEAISGQGFRRAPEDMGGQGGLAIWAEQGDDWTFCQCA